MEHPKQSIKDLEHFVNETEYAQEHLKLMNQDFLKFADKWFKITPPIIFFNTLWASTALYLCMTRTKLESDDPYCFSEMAKRVTENVVQHELELKNKENV